MRQLERSEMRAIRVDDEWAALASHEHPVGRVWWTKVRLVDLPDDLPIEDLKSTVAKIVHRLAVDREKLVHALR